MCDVGKNMSVLTPKGLFWPYLCILISLIVATNENGLFVVCKTTLKGKDNGGSVTSLEP